MEPRYNEPLYNEVRGITNDFLYPSNGTIYKKQSRNLVRENLFCQSPSSETQGQKKGARESLNGQKNIYGTKKSKERRKEPLETMSYQTSSKRSPPFWLLIGARNKRSPRMASPLALRSGWG